MDSNIPRIAYKDFLINQKEPKRTDKNYVDFWLKHIDYCKSGVYVGGVYISGWLYWHLNFFKIPLDKKDEWGNKVRVVGTPPLRDNEYYIDWGKRQAIKQQRPIMMIGSRRIGKSTTLASKISYKSYIFKNSQSIVIGGSSTDINNITDYFTFFYERRPDCFSDLQKIGDWTKDGGNVDIAFSKRETTKTDQHTKKKGEINPITPHLIEVGKDNKYIYSVIAVRNLEHGAKSSKEELLAGLTPSEVIIDECAKFSYSLPYSALKPALVDSDGEYRTIPTFVGCVTAGNKVWDNNGFLKNIEDLKKDDGIIGFDTKKPINENIVHFNPPQKKECVKITTRGKREIECSIDHPILTLLKDKSKICYFKKAGDIVEGDKILSIDTLDSFGEYNEPDARLLGLLIGDGYYGGDYGCEIYISEEDIFEYIKNKYNFSISVVKKQRNSDNLYRRLYLHSGSVKDIIEKSGIRGQSKKRKTLPIQVGQYNKESLSNLIGGYFDADGNVKEDKKGHISIVLTSYHKDLLEQIKFYLTKFGINGLLNKEHRKNGYSSSSKDIYRLYISRYNDVCKFIDNITLLNKKKQEKLNNYRKRNLKNPEKIHSGLTFRVIGDSEGGFYEGREIDNVRLNLVTEVKKVGEKDVYNLTTEKTNTYLVNNFITHNTGGNIDKSADTERDFLGADKNDFTVIDVQHYLQEVNEEYFRYKQQSDLKVSLFPMAEMSNAGGKKLEIPLHEYVKKEYTKQDLKDLEGFTIHVTDWDNARERVIKEIKKEENKSDAEGKKAQMYYPFQPEDCFLYSGSNPFPVEEAKKTQKTLEETGMSGEFAVLSQDEQGRVIVNGTDKDIVRKYPFEGGSYDAPVVIYERPISEDPMNIKYGTYVAGFDGYKIGTSETTDSLGTLHIFKRNAGISGYRNQVVASYASRPPQESKFHRQVYLLLKMYNAEVLPERDTSLHNYLKGINQLKYIANCKNLAEGITPNTKADHTYGLAPTQANKEHILKLIQDYCNEEIVVGYTEEDEPIYMKGVERIHDTMLLEEIIQFGKFKNYDRIISFGHALAWNAELGSMGYTGGSLEGTKQMTADSLIKHAHKKRMGRYRRKY